MDSTVRRLIGRKSRIGADDTSNSFPYQGYTGQRRIKSLTGCKMCSQLWDFFVGQLINNSGVNVKLEGEYLRSKAAMNCLLCSIISYAVEQALVNLPVDLVSLHTSSVGGPLDMVVWLTDGDTRSFELYTHPDEPSIWPALGPARSILKDSNSASCFALVAEWLKTCLISHEQCKAAARACARANLPHRVLKIGSEGDMVHLYEPTRKEKQPYAALSYCWGGALQEKTKTTVATVARNSEGICVQALPLTVQHAIIIARELGLAYLWVDSLCIIQDSAADWQRESALMCDIYSNATITISADGSADCQSGCFVASPYRNVTIATIPCPTPYGGTTNIYLRRSGFRQEANGAHATQNLSRPRLDNRGWTLQERLLSPRILHCTSTELVWQCSARVACECQVIEKEEYGFAFAPFRTLYVKNLSRKDETLDWRHIVSEYTQRDLTEQTDRLPAISGLAAIMRNTPPFGFSSESYLFGIWRTDITRNLLWHVELSKGDSSNESGPRESHRQAGRYAPTWSWASVTGRISYIDEVRDENRRETQLDSRLVLLNSTIVLDTKNEYGPGSGELAVARNFLHPVITRKSIQHKFDVFDARESVDSQVSIAVAIPDVVNSREGEIIPDKTYHWLLVAEITALGRSSVKDQGVRPIGLLLERCSGSSEEVYRRIGLVIGHLRTLEWNKFFDSVREAQEESLGSHQDALNMLTGKSERFGNRLSPPSGKLPARKPNKNVTTIRIV